MTKAVGDKGEIIRIREAEKGGLIRIKVVRGQVRGNLRGEVKSTQFKGNTRQ